MTNHAQFSKDPNQPQESDVILSTVTVNDTPIFIYEVQSIGVNTLADWAERVLDTIQNIPVDQPYLALYDLTQPRVALRYSLLTKQRPLNLAITNEGLDEVEKIVFSRPQFQARVAYLYSETHSGHVGQTFAKLDLRRQLMPMIDYKIFFDRDKALAWLSHLN